MDVDAIEDQFGGPGLMALFGSGETSPSGQKIFNELFKRLPDSPEVAILETPAGFELNSPRVAGRIGEFLSHRLQNYDPEISIIPARKRGTRYSPDDPEIAERMLRADLIFMGPGSPTYAVKQLSDSLTWYYLVARHRLGTGLALASAATIAISAFALPVYEIYKVGEDIHWKPGLDFFKDYNLNLVFIPHWNNSDGGEELDTSRCFVGLERFGPLLEMLPSGTCVVGIDENTGLIIDFEAGKCHVVGNGNVILVRDGREEIVHNNISFGLGELGDYQRIEPEIGIPKDVWLKVKLESAESTGKELPPERVLAMVKMREVARVERNWGVADQLRNQIEKMGWQVVDTQEGPLVEKNQG